MTTTSRARPVGPVVRRRLVVRGVVQGVGFRPHLALLAEDLGLAGGCHNDATSVEVEVEGPAAAVAEFEQRLVVDAPPLARVESVVGADVPTAGAQRFVIDQSTPGSGARTMVPPDTAPCAACLHELADPADRRHRHPFITCTHCGPRLTITLDLPYDRAQTTMAGFPLCPACAVEYADPRDRRYHAQPVACHDCGPRLVARTPGGEAGGDPAVTGTEAVLAAAIEALRAGRIVAIKGLGGYHLACDAADADAVAELRARKHRPDQPFAVMARDLATAERLVELGAAAELLTSPERPIVLLPARPDAPVADAVAPGLGELGVLLPYTPLHHLLFADRPDDSPGAPPVLVMTSGNRSGEPLCHTDEDALTRLRDVADLFVCHDRAIAVPVEDSVVAWSEAGPVPIRRSRGYAPLPVELVSRRRFAPPQPAGTATPPQPAGTATPPQPAGTATPPQPAGTATPPQPAGTATPPQPAGTATPPQPAGTATPPQPAGTATPPQPAGTATPPQPAGTATPPQPAGTAAPPQPAGAPVVLAAGAELKNTIALARDGRAFVSAHVGDLETLASREAHQRVTDQLLRFHRSTPALLVADRHPGYASRQWAHRLATELVVPVLEVQHHHAHLASLAAEHGRLDEPLLGLVLDGTGYGCDATVWGGELLLLGDGGSSADRLGHLGTVLLPGGDAGVRNPVRTAALAMLAAGVPLAGTPVGAELSAAEAAFLTRAHASGEGVVATSSAGRLFDVAAALLGVRHRISYEAQAAVELEAVARRWRRTTTAAAPALALPVTDHAGDLVLDPHPLVRDLVAAYADGAEPGALAWAFHETLAAAAADLAAHAASSTGVRTVGLSGGVYVNRLLLAATTARLRERDLEVLTHARVPANDGGLALGQVAVGHRHLTAAPTPTPPR